MGIFTNISNSLVEENIMEDHTISSTGDDSQDIPTTSKIDDGEAIICNISKKLTLREPICLWYQQNLTWFLSLIRIWPKSTTNKPRR
jgi:hypothetical protein